MEDNVKREMDLTRQIIDLCREGIHSENPGAIMSLEQIQIIGRELMELLGDVAGKIVIERKAGLDYCGGDRSLYKMVLELYLQEACGRVKNFDRWYGAGDWTAYSTEAHNLKSASSTIGATAFAEVAYQLEGIGDFTDPSLRQQLHTQMKDEYRKVQEAVSLLIEEFDENGADQ